MSALSRNVVLLAAASLIADVSGEIVTAVLPFLLVAQGASGFAVGVVGGLTDAIGHALKALSGAWADRVKRRKPFIVAGYATAAVSRLGIALAAAWPLTLVFRGFDRLGKGMRTAPRDALLAESVVLEGRGRAFGLHRAADTTGAILGSLVAFVGVTTLHAPPSTLILLAAGIGLGTLLPLAFVRERGLTVDRADRPEPGSPRFRTFLLVAVVFDLGNVSYLFFLLRAGDALGGEGGALGLWVFFNVVYASLAYPLGIAGDRWGRPRVLVAGYLLLAAAAATLALAPTVLGAVASFVLLGGSYAAVDGTERAYAADLAGRAGRSTKLGVYHMGIGLATVAGGLVAGGLYDVRPAWAFLYGATLALVAAGLLLALGFTRRQAGS